MLIERICNVGPYEILKLKELIGSFFNKGVFSLDVLKSKKRNIIFKKGGGRLNGTNKHPVV